MIDVAYFLALFLVFLRITSYFIAVEIFFPSGTPQILKGVFSLILSFGIISGIDYSTMNEINNSYILVFYAISEIMTGLILGYISNLVFQAVKLAGAWMDIHAGFSMVSLPFKLIIFVMVDGWYLLTQSLVKSFM